MIRKDLENIKRKKKTLHTGKQDRSFNDLSSETIQARRPWNNIINVLGRKKKDVILYTVKKKFFKNKGEIKTSLDKQKVRKLSVAYLHYK